MSLLFRSQSLFFVAVEEFLLSRLVRKRRRRRLNGCLKDGVIHGRQGVTISSVWSTIERGIEGSNEHTFSHACQFVLSNTKWTFYNSKVTSILNLLIYSFIHSFIHSFNNSFIHSFIHAFIHSFIQSFIHSLLLCLIHSFIYPFIHISIHPFIHSFIHSVIHQDAI